MHILRALETLERLETGIAYLYEWYSKLFSKEEDGGSALFYRLSIEESVHANIVSFQRRIVSQNLKMFGEVSLDFAGINDVFSKIESARNLDPPPSLERALEAALEIENSAAECHYKNAIAMTIPDVVPLLKSLGSFDASHSKVVEGFARKLGFSFSIMKNEFIDDSPKNEIEDLPDADEKHLQTELPDELDEETMVRINYFYTWYKNMGYYKVFNITEYATDAEVRNAYRVMAKEFHPDRYPALRDDLKRKVTEIFEYLNTAYRTLIDPRLRKEYDNVGRKSTRK
jgi:rubrerythrin/DnaJ-domain-containing protein 1